MKQKIHFRTIEGDSPAYYGLIIVLGAMVLSALGATWYMEHNGHHITGMNNQIAWGLPHVFAVFLIVAASGALNIASIGTIFGKKAYKPLARLSGLLAMCLLIGGLAVLLLDLGRPDRLIIAMTEYNFKSIFAWNIILYSGFMVLVGIYLWTMMDKSKAQYNKMAGLAAFIWRILLTTGTGSIFGFLVARQGYDAAIMAPMFIVMSFAYGKAIFILVLMTSSKYTNRPLGDAIITRLKNLMGIFVAASLYFVLAYHLTNLYATEHHAYEAFILKDGGIYTQLFWIGQIIIGGLIPLVILFHPSLGKSRPMIAAASIMILIGGFAQMYVTIIGGQAFPLILFPGMEVSSSFFDGVVAAYTPSLPEFILGIGGVAIALIAVAIAVKILDFLPEDLSDKLADPHYLTSNTD